MEGIMTSGDVAYSMASKNELSAKDNLVLIAWLCRRIDYLEEQLNLRSDVVTPILPSQIGGFNCYSARDEMVRSAMLDIQR